MAGTKTSAIYLEGLPGYVSKQKLLIYFGNHTKSGGGEVNEEETVLNEDAGTATVVFDDEQGKCRWFRLMRYKTMCYLRSHTESCHLLDMLSFSDTRGGEVVTKNLKIAEFSSFK